MRTCTPLPCGRAVCLDVEGPPHAWPRLLHVLLDCVPTGVLGRAGARPDRVLTALH